jgi:hypothetical protein
MNFAVSQDAFAEALLDPAHALPEGITSARGTADAARFAVYRNNVHVGLTAALAKRFPVVRRLVGEEFFAGMARVYAGLYKPASPLLFEYGDGFPEFIACFEPARELTYLADVARIEAAWTRVYHAEDAEPLAASQLTVLEPGILSRTRLLPYPSASLVASPHPVGSIWAAHQGATVEPVHIWRPETVLVARPVMKVSVHILPADGAAFAEALFAGTTLSDAAGRAAVLHADFDFGAALLGLVSLGAFCAMIQEDDTT